MTITAHVYNHGITLPDGIEVPEGTEVQVTLPPGPAASDHERAAWLAQSERRLLEVWDNDADDVYNELASTPVPNSENALEWMLEFIGTIQGPSDMAAQHDHYARGTPKRTDA